MFVARAQCETKPSETLLSVCYVIQLFKFRLTARRERSLNPISSQVPINPENLEILAKLICVCGLLSENVWIHIDGSVMEAWRRGECQGGQGLMCVLSNQCHSECVAQLASY